MNKKLIVRYLFWLLTLSLMIFIFYMSSQTRQESGDTSESFIRTFLNLFNFLNETEKTALVEELQFIVRKMAHFSIYATLGVFSFSALSTYEIEAKFQIGISSLICLLYSISDEIHQTFVDGRGGRLYDVGVDFLGSVCGIFILYLIIKTFKKRRVKNA